MPAKKLQTILQRLTALEQERASLIAERDALICQRSGQHDNNAQTPAVLSPQQKIALFKQRFKGRSDVFAKRWENSKGKSGYTVTCHNEWVAGTCNKSKIKCSECPNQRYRALDDQVIYDHLTGKQIIGLYPLLTDNTCHLLAADFDKLGWQEAIKALALACLHYSIPHAIEISRSGNGAHLWIFFSEPVPAREARLLGFRLLDQAMELHPDLSFSSYDRLFPNQDLMPAGGFGNLIALPLQYRARQQGNTRFVDHNLVPYTDQWHFLSQVSSLSSGRLSDFLDQFTSDTRVISQENLLDDRMPWEQGTKIKPVTIDNCPKQITLTLANHIYIELDDIPAALAARLKRLASFSNPKFFKTQAMRFSTQGIPRYITCTQIEHGPGNSKWLSLPRGCFDDVLELLNEQNISVAVDDKRETGKQLESIVFLGKLRKDQSRAVDAMTQYPVGVLHAPTAFGKTVTAIGIIAKRKTSTLILTHSRQLLKQWQERLQSFLSHTEIGVIGGGKKQPSGQVDIATYQSLINKKDSTVDLLVQNYGQIIIDECHHLGAPQFQMVLNEARAMYVLGLTATPDRQDGHQKIIFMTAGPIRHKIYSNPAEKFEQRVIVSRFYHQPPIELTNTEQRPHISAIYRWLADDRIRTQKIINDVMAEIADGKHPLVLTERRQHAQIMNQILIQNGINSVILRGAMRAREYKAANQQLPNAQVIVATGKYAGEGFDLPKLDTLFLGMPIAWKGTLAQYAGRIHRESDGKDQVTIFDYIDTSLPMLNRMFKKREKGYKAMGYQITFDENAVQS